MGSDILQCLNELFNEKTYKVVLSKPKKGNVNFKRVVIDLYSDNKYLIEKYTKEQVFHANMNYDETYAFLLESLQKDFSSCNAWDEENEYSFFINRLGAVNFSRKKISGTAPARRTSHNKEKNYILKEGTIIEPLVDLGIFSPEGNIIKGMHNKYKQINRILEIINDEVEKLNKQSITVVDYGCGKSYLTFVLYYYFKHVRNLDITMIGIDRKEEVIKNCRKIAEKYKYDKLKFIAGDIESNEYEDDVDIVIALHACDTATDYALFHALKKKADYIFVAPCCQHEICGQIKNDEYMWILRHGALKERLSALLTDAIRCNILEYFGYKTQLVEFVPFEHTPKNLLIRAVRKRNGKTPKRLEEVNRLVADYNLNPTLLKLIKTLHMFNK